MPAEHRTDRRSVFQPRFEIFVISDVPLKPAPNAVPKASPIRRRAALFDPPIPLRRARPRRAHREHRLKQTVFHAQYARPRYLFILKQLRHAH
jgi:hypothetical protein